MKKYIEIKNKKECCGCTACLNKCPTNAIYMEEDNEGFKYPRVDKSKCIECGMCRKACPIISRDYENVSINAYGVKLKEEEERKTSRSGGFFVAVSNYVLEMGGTVYGVMFDKNFTVIHGRASTKKESEAFKGSKYVQSDLKKIFTEVKKDLEDGKYVLFSGTGCQISGIKKFLGNINTEKLILCDIICHGVASPKIYKNFLKFISKGKKIEKVNFRDKKFGWRAHFETINYEKKSISTNYYTNLFYSSLIIRPVCFTCKWANLNRESDFTLGDFWGIEKVKKEFDDNKGVSLILVNTNKARKIFDNLKENIGFFECNIEDCMQKNLEEPTEEPKDRNIFWEEYSKKGFKYIMKKYAGYTIKNRIKFFVKNIIK